MKGGNIQHKKKKKEKKIFVLKQPFFQDKLSSSVALLVLYLLFVQQYDIELSMSKVVCVRVFTQAM